jgi:hypothetical protein
MSDFDPYVNLLSMLNSDSRANSMQVEYNRNGNKVLMNGYGEALITFHNGCKIRGMITFYHKSVNDYNQYLCINEGGEFEELDRVFEGLKPFGITMTSDIDTANKYMKYSTQLGFLASMVLDHTFDDGEKMFRITVSPQGTLRSFFGEGNLSSLQNDYKKAECKDYIIEDLKQYVDVDFKTFHHGKLGCDSVPYPVFCLLLGWPVEDTISTLKYHHMYDSVVGKPAAEYCKKQDH